MPSRPHLLAVATIVALATATAAPAQPTALAEGIQIRRVTQVGSRSVRLARDPTDGEVYLLSQAGVLFRVKGLTDPAGGSLEVTSTAADYGGHAPLGLGIGPDGTFYIADNDKADGHNTVSILKGVVDVATGRRVWSVLARTEPYPISDTAFDHDVSAIAVGPDNRYLYVNSGSRTDHGEEQSNGGRFPGLREIPLTSAIWRLPTGGEGFILPNDESALRAAGYLFADGIRNTFDLGFAPNGDLIGVENGPDRDTPEEINWLREGQHYGFPWRMADEDNPQRFAGYDPASDRLVRDRSTAFRLGSYHDDPGFPPPPAGVTFIDPIPNGGPDADQFRDPVDGQVKDGSDLGLVVRTLTPHRSPLGLVFDADRATAEPYRGDAFVLNIGDAIAPDLGEPFPRDNDLLHVELSKNGSDYEARVRRIVAGFRGPIDAVMVGNRIYVLEFAFSGTRDLWEVTLPAAPAAERDAEDTSVELAADHAGWGWEALVLRNDLIELAVVPSIGGRVMQYDLDGHPSVFVNPLETGNTYAPADGAPWHNFGGYKTWPAPQDRWGWPPPPTLDAGAYAAEVTADTPDSVVVTVTSPVERWQTPGLRFTRRLSIYPHTSRVRVAQTLVNEGGSAQTWSVWDVTQAIVHHAGEGDDDSFRVYLPLNPDSRYGARSVRVSAESGAWLGEVADGIFGARYRPDNAKLFADPADGWVCYADERDGYTFCKTFGIDPAAAYPDDGARVEVWVNADPPYLEVEVLGPLAQVAAGGGSHTFVEQWWATRMRGPVRAVSEAGAVARSLDADRLTGELSGTYGVFHRGWATVALLDGRGGQVGAGRRHPVTPAETFALRETVSFPAAAVRAVVRLEAASGEVIGELDRLELPVATSVADASQSQPDHAALGQAYPNPFNASVTLPFSMPWPAADAQVTVYNLLGERVRALATGPLEGGEHRVTWDGRDERGAAIASGVYVVRLRAGPWVLQRKVMLLR